MRTVIITTTVLDKMETRKHVLTREILKQIRKSLHVPDVECQEVQPTLHRPCSMTVEPNHLSPDRSKNPIMHVVPCSLFNVLDLTLSFDSYAV